MKCKCDKCKCKEADPWQEAVEHVAEKLKEAIDEQILKEIANKPSEDS